MEKKDVYELLHDEEIVFIGTEDECIEKQVELCPARIFQHGNTIDIDVWRIRKKGEK